MPISTTRALTVAVTAASIGSAIVAADTPAPDPAVYLQAFNDTCRRGFPDLDLIAGNAGAHGWQESKMRLRGGEADIISDTLPRAFHKDGLMLFLTRPPAGQFKAVCQVTGSAATKLSGADIAAVVTPSLSGRQPTIDQSRESDGATWAVAPSITVHAGISIYHKMRTISISVRQQS